MTGKNWRSRRYRTVGPAERSMEKLFNHYSLVLLFYIPLKTENLKVF